MTTFYYPDRFCRTFDSEKAALAYVGCPNDAADFIIAKTGADSQVAEQRGGAEK